jgi:hypothetical protein
MGVLTFTLMGVLTGQGFRRLPLSSLRTQGHIPHVPPDNSAGADTFQNKDARGYGSLRAQGRHLHIFMPLLRTQEKSRLSAGLSCSRLVLLRTSAPAVGSDLGDWGPAAAGRASARRLAAVDRASGWGSGSAGPDSGSDWTSGSPLLNVAAGQPKDAGLVALNPGSGEIIAWRRPVAIVATEPLGRTGAN